jgi:hypothetical protein
MIAIYFQLDKRRSAYFSKERSWGKEKIPFLCKEKAKQAEKSHLTNIKELGRKHSSQNSFMVRAV